MKSLAPSFFNFHFSAEAYFQIGMRHRQVDSFLEEATSRPQIWDRNPQSTVARRRVRESLTGSSDRPCASRSILDAKPARTSVRSNHRRLDIHPLAWRQEADRSTDHDLGQSGHGSHFGTQQLGRFLLPDHEARRVGLRVREQPLSGKRACDDCKVSGNLGLKWFWESCRARAGSTKANDFISYVLS